MKLIFVLALVLNFSQAQALDTVKNLDLESYMGQWYEIGSIPQSFSEDCIGNTTAEYKLLDNGRVEVINSCDEEQGRETAKGRARINKEFNENSKLEVTFVNFFGAWGWFAAGDYWVIKLNKNYKWAVVGHPDRDFLWILSRRPKLSRKVLRRIRHDMEAKGFNSCDVKMTAHDRGKYKGTERLCDLRL